MKEINIFFDLDGVVIDLKSTIKHQLKNILASEEERKKLLEKDDRITLKHYYWYLNTFKNINNLSDNKYLNFITDFLIGYLTLNDAKLFENPVIYDEMIDFIRGFKNTINTFSKNIKIYILSAYFVPKNLKFTEEEKQLIKKRSLQEKTIFINKHLNTVDDYFIVQRKEKANYAKKYEYAVLIDDYKKNTEEFTKNGGFGILFNSETDNVLDLKNKLLIIINEFFDKELKTINSNSFEENKYKEKNILGVF